MEREEDPLLEKANEKFHGLSMVSDPQVYSMAGYAINSYSVGFMIEPFNGYWQTGDNETGYEIIPLEDDRNVYAEPMIRFWLTLAITMAIYGEWGFGKATRDN